MIALVNCTKFHFEQQLETCLLQIGGLGTIRRVGEKKWTFQCAAWSFMERNDNGLSLNPHCEFLVSDDYANQKLAAKACRLLLLEMFERLVRGKR